MQNEQIPELDPTLSSIHNRLFFRLFQAGNILDRQSTKEMGISPVNWAVLGALSRKKVADGMSFSDLTEYLGVSRQNLDGVLKRLERDDYVIRFADEVDRRVKLVKLTDAGRFYWEGLQMKIYEFYSQALNGFVFDDKVALVHFINKLNQGMKNVSLSNADE